jgi:hypothetical protein
MTIPEQVAELDRAIQDLVRCVSGLNDDLFLRKLNGWSPRDVVAHLIGWNRHAIQGSEQILKGELPFYDVEPGENYSEVNAELVRTYSSTNRLELLTELRASGSELGRFLRSVRPEDWKRDFGVRHRGVCVTIRDTVEELIVDYSHHQSQIEDGAT